MSLLITGSTGFLGNNFLHLLQKYEYPNIIYLLIRDKNQNAMERFIEIKNVFHKLNLHLIDIDLSQISSLDLKVDRIIHCAASISFDLELQEAVKQNVDNVIEIIKYANKNKISKIISADGHSGTNRTRARAKSRDHSRLIWSAACINHIFQIGRYHRTDT